MYADRTNTLNKNRVVNQKTEYSSASAIIECAKKIVNALSCAVCQVLYI